MQGPWRPGQARRDRRSDRRPSRNGAIAGDLERTGKPDRIIPLDSQGSILPQPGDGRCGWTWRCVDDAVCARQHPRFPDRLPHPVGRATERASARR
jgi:hypothetical protein